MIKMIKKEKMIQFKNKHSVDTTTSAEAILSLSAESRDRVDELVNKALSSGGKSYSEPQDHGFMYIWGFQDLDGHLWEVAYMDESAINQE